MASRATTRNRVAPGDLVALDDGLPPSTANCDWGLAYLGTIQRRPGTEAPSRPGVPPSWVRLGDLTSLVGLDATTGSVRSACGIPETTQECNSLSRNAGVSSADRTISRSFNWDHNRRGLARPDGVARFSRHPGDRQPGEPSNLTPAAERMVKACFPRPDHAQRRSPRGSFRGATRGATRLNRSLFYILSPESDHV